MRTNANTAIAFEVWARKDDCDNPHTELAAAFAYFPEALDYVDYVTSRGVTCIVRTLGIYSTVRVDIRAPKPEQPRMPEAKYAA